MAPASAPEQGFRNYQLRLRSWPFSFYGFDYGSFWSKFWWLRLSPELKFTAGRTIVVNSALQPLATISQYQSGLFNCTNQSIFRKMIEVFPKIRWSAFAEQRCKISFT